MLYVLSNKILGCGSFSTVYEGYSQTRQRVAIKKISCDTKNSIYEFFVLKNIKHANLARCVEIFKSSDKIYMIMPRANNNLSSEIKQGKFGDTTRSFKAFVQILKAISVLHDLKIVHGDVKSTNVLVYPLENFKLCDFSMSCRGTMFNHITCTKQYRAPECMLNKSWNSSIDIWSAGCIFYELIEHKTLFNEDFFAILEKAKDKKKIYEDHLILTSAHKYRIVFDKMLQVDESKRLKASKICEVNVEYDIIYTKVCTDWNFSCLKKNTNGMISLREDYNALEEIDFDVYGLMSLKREI